MREVEVDDVVREKNNQQADQERVERQKAVYNSLGSMEERVDFLVDIFTVSRVEQMKNGQANMKVSLANDDLLQDFTKKYIVNGSREKREYILTYLGKRIAMNNLEIMKQRDKFLKELPQNDPLRDRKALYLARETADGHMLTVLNFLTQSFKNEYCSNDRILQSAMKDSNINENSTMGDLAKVVGKKLPGNFKESDKNKNAMAFFKNNDDAIAALVGTAVYEQYLINGQKQYMESRKMSETQIKEYTKVRDKARGEQSKSKIEDWVETTGDQYMDPVNLYHEVASSFEKKYLRKEKEKSKVDEQLKEIIVREYAGKKTLEEQLRALIDHSVVLTCTQFTEEGGMKQATDANEELLSQFIDEKFVKGSPKDRKKIIEALGTISAENTLQLMRDEQEYLNQFPADDERRMKKAVFLARSGMAGARHAVITDIMRSCQSNYSREQIVKETWEDMEISDGITMGEFARRMGFDKEQTNAFLAEKHAGPKDLAFDIYRNELTAKNVPDIDDQDIALAMYDDMKARHFLTLHRQSAEKYVKEQKLSVEDTEKYRITVEKTTKELSTGGIEEWTQNEGKEMADSIQTISSKCVVNEFLKARDTSKGFGRYIGLHTGTAQVKGNTEAQKDNLAKAVAAGLLQDAGEPFDIDQIHAFANSIKANGQFMDIVSNPKKLKESLADPKSAENVKMTIVRNTYKVDSDRINDYLKDMSTLYKNLMSSDKRSTEYKIFHKVCKDIVELKGNYDLKNPNDRKNLEEKIVDLNAKLLSSINAYTKGKKSVRGTQNGQKRFDNSLDALGILIHYAPGTKPQADVLVNKINAVRKAAVGSEKHVDITRYNAERAAAANQLRR